MTLGVSPTRSNALINAERNPCCALGITSLLVVDAAGRMVGALNTHDLMRAKVI